MIVWWGPFTEAGATIAHLCESGSGGHNPKPQVRYRPPPWLARQIVKIHASVPGILRSETVLLGFSVYRIGSVPITQSPTISNCHDDHDFVGSRCI
jgi:hypothetical protein